MRTIPVPVVLALAMLVAGCSGGSGNGPTSTTLPPTPQSTGAIVPQTVSFAVNAGTSTHALPSSPTFSGNVALAVQNAAPGAALTLTALATTQLPHSITALKAGRGSQSLDPATIYAAQLNVSGNISLNRVPDFTLTSAAFQGLTSTAISYALYDDTALTHVVAGSSAATSVSDATATFAGQTANVTFDTAHTYTLVFFAGTNGIAAQFPQSAFFAIPGQDAILAVDVSQSATTPAYRIIGGSKTSMSAPFDVASGPSGEMIVLNKQSGGFSPLPVNTNGAVFDRNATGDASPLRSYRTDNTNITALAGGPTGIVYGIGQDNEGRNADIYDLNGADLTLAGIAPPLGAFRRFLNIQKMTSAVDGQVAGVIDDFGAGGGNAFNEVSMTIAGTAQYLTFASQLPTDPQIQVDFDIVDFEFNPNDNKLYVLSRAKPSANCADPLATTLRVYPRAGFNLEAPAAVIPFPADVANVSKIRFDKSGQLFAWVATPAGKSLVNAYADPAANGHLITTRSISVDALLHTYATNGFAVQVQ